MGTGPSETQILPPFYSGGQTVVWASRGGEITAGVWEQLSRPTWDLRPGPSLVCGQPGAGVFPQRLHKHPGESLRGQLGLVLVGGLETQGLPLCTLLWKHTWPQERCPLLFWAREVGCVHVGAVRTLGG